MKSAQEVLDQALESSVMSEGIRPGIIFQRDDVDFRNVVELEQAYVNGSWGPMMKEWLEKGFILFLVQTEFQVNGHHVCAYFAKLKSN